MEVIDFEPNFWYFLQQGNNYFIDVYCSYSFLGYSRFIKLDESESKEYSEKGRAFINDFANDIQYNGMDKKYAERNITDETYTLAHNKILEFNTENKH